MAAVLPCDTDVRPSQSAERVNRNLRELRVMRETLPAQRYRLGMAGSCTHRPKQREIHFQALRLFDLHCIVTGCTYQVECWPLLKRH